MFVSAVYDRTAKKIKESYVMACYDMITHTHTHTYFNIIVLYHNKDFIKIWKEKGLQTYWLLTTPNFVHVYFLYLIQFNPQNSG